MKTIQIFILIVISLHSFAQFTDINPDKDVLRASNGISFINSQTGYLISLDSTHWNLFRTNNSGDSWSIMFKTFDYMNIVKFLNDSIGFRYGTPPQLTTDQGKTFNDIQGLPINQTLENIYFGSGNNVFLNYSKDGVFKSSDFGKNWKKVFNNTLLQIHFINDSVGYGYSLVGSKYYTFKSIDNGDTWRQEFEIPFYFEGFQFVNTNVAYGFYRTKGVVKTSDGGKSWDTSFSKGTWISDMQFIDENTGFILDETGLYKTIDAGDNWHLLAPPQDANEMEIFYNQKKVYIYLNMKNASYTSIHKGVFDSTEIWSSIPVKNIQATQFKIYPNPAKSEITISYTGFVKMGTTGNIYDVSGRNVKTFTIYNPNTVVNLKGLSKGVYILKIRTENSEFVERFVKK